MDQVQRRLPDLVLPRFAVGILLRRKVENPANPHGAVFPTRRGTWRQISNWERMWNQVVDDTAYDWVTFHTFRRSVATLIDREVDSAQAQLGHPDSHVTRDSYPTLRRERVTQSSGCGKTQDQSRTS